MTPRIPPAAVIFDCDGVIVDSEGPTLELLREDLAAHGLPLTIERLETEFIGGTIELVGERARAAGADLPSDWAARFYDDRLYPMLAAGTPLIPGVRGLLDRLDAAAIPFAMGSNGTARKMEITLGQHGLLDRFRVLLSGQDIGSPKPAPDIYLRAAAACGAAPADCLVIEDSPTGARAAIAAGIPCFGFAAHGMDTPPARGLAALGLPIFHHMRDLPALIGI